MDGNIVSALPGQSRRPRPYTSKRQTALAVRGRGPPLWGGQQGHTYHHTNLAEKARHAYEGHY